MAGTDRSKPNSAAVGPAIVLVEPQLGENIGMAARAMANFGLSDLRLVNPREPWPNDKAVAAAAGADAVIGRAKVFGDLSAAIGDCSLVMATTARPRDMFVEVIGADAGAARIVVHVAGGSKAAVVFGRERFGLTNEEIAAADAIVTLPVAPGFASLNLAQAVVIVAYEWRRAARGGAPAFAGDPGPAATREELEGLIGHLEAALDGTGFFGTDAKRPSMLVNLRTMLTRAGFNAQEVRTLRGVISALEKRRG